MPRTRRPKVETAPIPASVIGTIGEVLTLAEAAAYLRLPEAEVITAVHTQALPARFVGGEWRFLKSAIQEWLNTASPTDEMRKMRQLAIAGTYKDDPDLEQILEDAMKSRGRRPRPDGTYSGHNPV